MSIESLTAAAKAAGFAMAPADDADEQSWVPVRREPAPPRPALPARKPVVYETLRGAALLKGVYGIFGRGAPA